MFDTQHAVPRIIDFDDIHEWIDERLKPLYPEDTHISVIPFSWDCTGESQFVSFIDIDKPITLKELMAREVKEHSRGNCIHFYVDDIIHAAVGNGDLDEDWFMVHYKW